MTTKWTAKNIPELVGKIAIVTGANSGIGFETARALATKKATVILACRNKDEGEAAIDLLTQENPDSRIFLLQLNLSDLALVRDFSDSFIRQYDRLDILINNAGIMRTPYGNTVDGFELQFGTNHLGHFALTGLLIELIIRTPQARVITVSSGGERFGEIDFENLNAENGYDAGKAYGQSKLANLLFTYELQRQFEHADIDTIAAAVHPGWTITNLQVHWQMLQVLNPFIGQQPDIGALPTLYAATAPGVQGGDYYGPDGWMELRGHPTKVKSSDRSYDTAVAAQLWKISEELTGVRYWKNSQK